MLGVIIISIPLLIYLIGAFSVKKKEFSHPDDYFVAYKKVGVTAFSSSSIAYAFQVSTIYPFLFWGASKFYFVPAVNTIGWGLGILLFYFSFSKYKQFIGSDLTLHGFLGKYYGLSVRKVASYLTIIGFFGFALAETYFGSKVLLSIVADKNLFYLIIFIALIFVYGYITYGGQISSIRTDQLQLIIAYAGIFGLILYFMYLSLINNILSIDILPISYVILVIYIPIILFIRKFRFIKLSEVDSFVTRTLNLYLNIFISLLLIFLFLFSIYNLFKSDLSFNLSGFFNIEGFGIPGLISLTILPLCWQFVDLTNWQRLLSVKADTKDEIESLHKNIRKGLLIYSIESPFTWIIFLFFGVLTMNALPQFSFQDLLIDIPKQLISSSNIIHNFFGFTFIISILSIMLSTVDSFVVGVIFTFVYDSYSKTRIVLDSKDNEVIKKNYKSITRAGKAFGILLIFFGMVFFVIFDKNIANGGEMFINLLLAFYSAQLSLFPLVLGSLFLKRHPKPFWAIISMIVGASTGIILGVYSVIWNPIYAWYPIIVSVSLSAIIFLIGLIKKENKK